VLIRVLQPGFFAREDTKTPTIFAGVSVIINIVLSLLLFPSLKHVGIALATSVAAWANAVLLGVWLGRRGHFTLPAEDWRRHALIIVASLVMAAVLYGLSIPLAPYLSPKAPLIAQLVALGALCAFGAGLYFVLVHVTGAQRLDVLMSRLRRKPAA
jgi:putative peptidoglycan lipid II flippase